MKLYNIFIFLVLTCCCQISSACVTDELAADLDAVVGLGAKLFTSKKYSEHSSLLDGRRVLMIKDLQLGKPSYVDYSSIPKSYTKLRKLLEGGATNKELMSLGYAPIGVDGRQLEVHHLIGKEPGPVAEIEKSLHQRETKILHHMITTSFRNDPIADDSWKQFRKDYWVRRAEMSQ